MALKPERGQFPPVLQTAMRFLPPPPLGMFLTHAVRRLSTQRPDLFERLGAYKRAQFIVDPVDLPYVFKLVPNGEHAFVEMLPKAKAPQGDAKITGPLIVLLGLIDGTYDGDAMFFSRDLVIEGDTDAVLALRNTMEEADLTPAELIGLNGQLRDVVDRCANSTLANLRKVLDAPQAG
ncbi:ubiquinone anaerobic biosynthesis accessory factor UbiT [Polycladidibacter stylochi]|uniref:ubiquinone anaerobic biosynthesis accessory factor UbiT n=1 Tax=Polycladidibacter stylochi TaxID=1807766 RepID=UPI0008317B64|nr:SCP2 sterol-binding domain-containing protein [Pseudovibrio stylochi]